MEGIQQIQSQKLTTDNSNIEQSNTSSSSINRQVKQFTQQSYKSTNSFISRTILIWMTIVYLLNVVKANSQILDCPVFIHFPLDLVKNNLMFNQHEYLRKFLTFSSTDIDINGIHILNYQSEYLDQFDFERFSVIGKPDQVVQITAHNVPIQITIEYKERSSDEQKAQRVIKNELQMKFENITFDIQLVKDEQGFSLRLQNVESSIKQSSIYFIRSTNQQRLDERQLNTLTSSLLKKRAEHFEQLSMYEWFDLLPYGSIRLGEIFALISRGIGSYPHLTEISFDFCVGRNNPDAEDSQYFYDQVQLQSVLLNEVNPKYGQIVINQNAINSILEELRTSEEVKKIPLEKSQTQPTVASMKEHLDPFKNADYVEVELFFNEDTLLEYMDSEQYQPSSFKVDSQGIMNLHFNIGIYLYLYDEEGNLDQKLTAFLILKSKLQLHSSVRMTHSMDKPMLNLRLHQLQLENFEMYDENHDIISKESAMLFVRFNSMMKKFLNQFNTELNRLILLNLYIESDLGDSWNVQNLDTYGYHQVRTFAEYQEDQKAGIVLNYDYEKLFVDPYRYEYSYEAHSKEHECKLLHHYYLIELKNQTPFLGLFKMMKGARLDWCNHTYRHDPSSIEFYPQIQAQEVKILGINERADQTGFYIQQIHGKYYRIRYLYMVVAHLTYLIIMAIFIRIKSRSSSEPFKNKSQNSSS